MGRVCREIHEQIEEQVERRLDERVRRSVERCRRRSCNWWCACCNKWFCWLETIVVTIVRWVVVTVVKWIVRIVCEIVTLVLDLVALIVGLILSIPIIGGIIRTILGWLTEIVSRIAGLPDFILSLLGIRLRKKMYVGVVIPMVDGEPIAQESDVQPQIDALREVLDQLCNVRLEFTGFCRFSNAAPNAALNPECNAAGFFSDWWLAGSWYQLASTACKFQDGWRRLVGFGGEIIAFVVSDVEGKIGCSFGATYNYVVIEARPRISEFLLMHEVGHTCVLLHRDDAANLMNSAVPSVFPEMTNWQIAMVRASKHCVFL